MNATATKPEETVRQIEAHCNAEPADEFSTATLTRMKLIGFIITDWVEPLAQQSISSGGMREKERWSDNFMVDCIGINYELFDSVEGTGKRRAINPPKSNRGRPEKKERRNGTSLSQLVTNGL